MSPSKDFEKIHPIETASLARGLIPSEMTRDDFVALFPSHFSYHCNLAKQTVDRIFGVESVLGYPVEKFAKLPFFEILHPEDRNTVISVINEGYQHLRDNNEMIPLTTQFSITLRMRHENGEYRHIQHLIVYTVINAYGDALEVLNLCTDITQIPFMGVTAYLSCRCMGKGSQFSSLNPFPGGMGSKRHKMLTRREMEIVNLLSMGKTSLEIAEILSISKHTVDKHRANMLSKTGAVNTGELITQLLLPSGGNVHQPTDD